MIQLRSGLLIFLSFFLIVQVFVLLFTFREIAQLYLPNLPTEFIISAEALFFSKKPFNCPFPVLV